MKIVLAIVLMLISGCSLFTKTVYVPSEPVIIEADKQYRTPCKGSPPPDREVYERASAEYREVLWASAYTRATGQLVLCNQKILAGDEDIKRKRAALLATPPSDAK